jgi:hypothetical protein
MLLLLITGVFSIVHAAEFSVIATELRVRETRKGKLLCKIPKGTILTSLGNKKNNWMFVELPKSSNCPEQGYVSKEYLIPTPKLKSQLELEDAPIHPDKFALIETNSYDPKKERGRGFTQMISSLGLATFGNIYKATELGIEADLLEKLNMPEFSKYFPIEKESAPLPDKYPIK